MQENALNLRSMLIFELFYKRLILVSSQAYYGILSVVLLYGVYCYNPCPIQSHILSQYCGLVSVFF